ncbi:MAG: VTT domain-containing protein [Rubrivivax sp.]
MPLAVTDPPFSPQAPIAGCTDSVLELSAATAPRRRWRIIWALVLAAATLLCWIACQMPDPQWLLSQQAELGALQSRQPIAFGVCFFFVFTLLSALALPGCGVLAVAAGLYFGLTLGTALVVLASTVGATLSFLAARHWLRNTVQQRFGHRLQAVEDGLTRDGAFYLFSLRVAPLIPYALVNPLMGLSQMPLSQFFGVSLLGMLAGSAVYVYAGTALASVPLAAAGWSALFSPMLMAALLGLALLPWSLRAGLRTLRRSVWPRLTLRLTPRPRAAGQAS